MNRQNKVAFFMEALPKTEKYNVNDLVEYDSRVAYSNLTEILSEIVGQVFHN